MGPPFGERERESSPYGVLTRRPTSLCTALSFGFGSLFPKREGKGEQKERGKDAGSNFPTHTHTVGNIPAHKNGAPKGVHHVVQSDRHKFKNCQF